MQFGEVPAIDENGIIINYGVQFEAILVTDTIYATSLSAVITALQENVEYGIIINYEVRFEPLQFTAELATNSINTPDLSVTITGLEEYVEYNISVRAYTSVGPGPYSDPVTERTSEDGMYSTLSLLYSIVYTTMLYGSFYRISRISQATNIFSTAIMVTWEEVPAIDRNGIIINYEVRFEPLQFTGELTTSSV